MGHLDNTLKMIFELKKGKIIKKKELAEKFNVNIKQIARYKNVLDEFFTIESIPGPTGGYKLVDSYFPFKQLLTKEELMLLKLSINSLSYFDNEKLQKALDKINYSILNDNEKVSAQIIPYSRINTTNKNLSQIQFDIFKAIINKQQIIIDYVGNNGLLSNRVVEPYKLFVFKGEYYLVANCLKRNDIRFFKLVRIEHYIVTNKTFEKTINIEKKLSEYRENSIGIFSGEEYNLKLEISPPIANTIKERIWVKNQKIETLKDGTIIFEAVMKGKPEIITWILSMRSCVKIIEPKSLKDDLKKELEKMIKNL